MAKPRLFVVGTNDKGEFGPPLDDVVDVVEPTAALALLEPLPRGKYVAQVALGVGFTLVLDGGGELWAVGDEYDPYDDDNNLMIDVDPDDDDYDMKVGEMRAALDTRTLRRVTCSLGQRFTQVAVSGRRCMAVTDRGKLFTWGCDGESGDWTMGVLADVRVRFVASSCDDPQGHVVVLTSDSEVVVFGDNTDGQLGTGRDYQTDYEGYGYGGDPDFGHQRIPVRLQMAERIVSCAVGENFTQLVCDDGRVFAMGRNSNGQLGIGTTDYVNEPTAVECGERIVAVACGVMHTLLLTAHGELRACGDSIYGATGLGYVGDVLVPQRVEGVLADECIVRIAAAQYLSCVLLADGRVFTFGTDPAAPAASSDDFGFPWKCTKCTSDFPVSLVLPTDVVCARCAVFNRPNRPPSRHMIPRLLRGALANTAVRTLALRMIECDEDTMHFAFIPGTPPELPGYDAPLTPAWHRRRTLLMCLLRLECAPPIDAPAGASDVLLYVAALPDEMWKGSLIFQYL